MATPCNFNTFYSQGTLVPFSASHQQQEQIDQIFQPVFSQIQSNFAHQYTSDRWQLNNEPEKTSSIAQISSKRAREDDATQEAVKRVCRREEEGSINQQSLLENRKMNISSGTVEGLCNPAGEWAGFIRITNRCGVVCEIERREGKWSNWATVTYSNSIYQGEVKVEEDRVHVTGSGKRTYSDERVIEGEWKNGKANGHCKETLLDGKVFEGEYKDDVAALKGKIIYTDGRIYEGDCRHYYGAQRNFTAKGHGRVTYPGGITFVGSFYNDLEDRGMMSYLGGRQLKVIIENN